MLCMCVLQRGHSGGGCVLASTLCKYDLRKGDLFVLFGQGATNEAWKYSSELLICGCCLLWLDAYR